jgi:hypothetical protein
MSSAEKALNLLRGAVLNARIYPPGSHIIMETVQLAVAAMTTCLAETRELKVSDIEGRLMINDKDEIHLPAFRSLMTEHEIQMLQFTAGLTPAEVEVIAEGLSKTKKDLGTPDGLPSWLSKRNITHIKAARVKYVAVNKDEQVVQRTSIEQATKKEEEILDGRDQYTLVLTDDSVAAQSAIIAELAGKSVAELKRIFESDLSAQLESHGLYLPLIGALSPEKITALFTEIALWAEHREESDLVRSQTQWLRKFIAAALQLPNGQQISQSLLQKLVDCGMLDRIPESFFQGQDRPSILQQTQQLLMKPPQALTRPEILKRLPEIISSLSALQADAHLFEILKRLIECLGNESPFQREAAVKGLGTFQNAIVSVHRARLLREIRTALLTVADAEQTSTVYRELMIVLGVSAIDALVDHELEEMTRILQLIRRHAEDMHPTFKARQKLAADALLHISQQATRTLGSDLNSTAQDRQAEGFRILALLGGDAAAPLIEILKQPGDQRTTQMGMAALRRMSPAARAKVWEQVDAAMPADALLRILTAARGLQDPTALPKITELLRHPNGSVRREALDWVSQFPPEKVGPMLLSHLHDPDPAVQATVVRMLRAQSVTKPVHDLLLLLRTAAPPLQEEIVQTLVEFKDAAIIPDLIKLLLKNRSSFFSRGPETPPSVRARCAWALGYFKLYDPAVAALEKATGDPNPLVQRHVHAALES